jgi:hypothetical protein
LVSSRVHVLPSATPTSSCTHCLAKSTT